MHYTPIMVITSHKTFLLLLLLRILIPPTLPIYSLWSLSFLGARSLISLGRLDPTRLLVKSGCGFSSSYLYNLSSFVATISNRKAKWIVSTQIGYFFLLGGDGIFGFKHFMMVFVDSFPTFSSSRFPLFQLLQCSFFLNFTNLIFGFLFSILDVFASSPFYATISQARWFCWSPGLSVATLFDFNPNQGFVYPHIVVDKSASWGKLPLKQLVKKHFTLIPYPSYAAILVSRSTLSNQRFPSFYLSLPSCSSK